MADDVLELDIYERSIILGDLQKLLELAGDSEQFLSRSKDLTLYQRKFVKVQTKIEKSLLKLKKFEKEEQLKIRNDFNDVYFSVVAHLNKLKREDEENKRFSRSIANSSFITTTSCQAKLPKLPLPSFGGESTDWPSFHDLFRSLVHNNSAYTEAEKFRYLLLTLKNEPFNLIKSIPITDENYSVALHILVSRYDNKRTIAAKHLDKILDLQPQFDKSDQSLRNLLNVYQENIKALEMMQFPIKQWSFVLLNILLRKITPAMRRRFELSLPNASDIPSVEVLINFLERELVASELSNSANSEYFRSRPTNAAGPAPRGPCAPPPHRSFAANVSTPDYPGPFKPSDQNNKEKTCPCCDAQHTLTKCAKFLGLTTQERYLLVQQNNVCFNCLNVGHGVNRCNSNFVCRSCHRRHHSLLHYDTQSLPTQINAAELGATSVAHNPMEESTTQHCMTSVQPILTTTDSASIGLNTSCASTNIVLLSTAIINVYANDDNSRRFKVRCLVDTGSQASFMTEACAQRLGLARRYTNVPVLGIGGGKPVHPKGVVSCCVTSRNTTGPLIAVDAFILPKLVSQVPSVPLPHTGWPHLENLNLVDPDFRTPQPVEMLLGADILPQILLGGVVTGLPGSPIAMNSVFGYLLLGKLSFEQNVVTPIQACFSSFTDDMDLQRFWELESLPEKTPLTSEELLCESMYEKLHTRDSTGRYIVPLPFKPDAPPLGESRDGALARFRKLERRLECNPTLKKDYHACLQEYVDLEHMELVDDSVSSGTTYYIPHHCVVRESETTKTRVVFDASSKTTNGYSLNDVLLTGPKLHQSIVDILLNFRINSIVMTADIKQMYRNILVQEKDRDFQRILWRKSPDETLREYRLRTVTFGVSASPYLALRTMQQLAHDESSRFKLGSEVLLKGCFVDDLICGESDEAKALVLQQELIGICQTAGFELRKWHSNSTAILAAALSPDSHGERPETVVIADLEKDKKTKILGLHWNPRLDEFTFSVRLSDDRCTKRAILSEISKIYDPMGWLSPVTLYAKYLIQLLWLSGVDWDEIPPTSIVNAWSNFTSELPLLSQISLPRHVFPNTGSIQLHAFCDASEKGYAACVYLRLTNEDNDTKIFLMGGKTRVSPLARVSIPRLELLGALLLSRLVTTIMRSYGDYLSTNNIFAWTDSSIVLAWLRSSPHEWKTYVANRTSEILSCIPASRWRHVPSADNPADAASRGMSPATFLQHTMWFQGPGWLGKDQIHWPAPKRIPETKEEKRNQSVVSNVTTDVPLEGVEIISSRCSSLGKLVRVTALIFRFYNKCKGKSTPVCSQVTLSEYNCSLTRLIQLVQRSMFADDIHNILQGKSPTHQLQRLNPFLDKDGLLRVGGRIHKSFLPYEAKHQVILPKKHILTFLLIDFAHISNLHGGPQLTQYSLMQKYWILSGRDIIRQRIHRCIRCFRARPVHPQPSMAPLPAARVRPERPFLKTAVDYAGPFYVRANKVRNAKVIKCYVAVFVCMSVKAIHLELVSELSTEGFLAALRRFISRRGLCTDIYSDCGSNFIGCNSYLRELYTFLNDNAVQSELSRKTLHDNITWHFQPPYASHFGGLFEAGVKSFKHHMYRVLGTHTQTYDEMHTLLCQIEAILNSRPLCVLSADPLDPLPLTPSHFLIGEPMTAIPDVSLLNSNPNRLSRWRWVQQSVQYFWKRWSCEYLHEIQQRSKWYRNRGSDICEGTIVVVRDDNLPPLHWKLARVQTVHRGSDNIVRVVTLQNGKNLFKRSVVKVCPLPLE